MPRKLSKSKLTEFAVNQAGADMIGFANIERFDNCPAEFHPHRLKEFTLGGWFPELFADKTAAPAMLEEIYGDADFSLRHMDYSNQESTTYDA